MKVSKVMMPCFGHFKRSKGKYDRNFALLRPLLCCLPHSSICCCCCPFSSSILWTAAICQCERVSKIVSMPKLLNVSTWPGNSTLTAHNTFGIPRWLSTPEAGGKKWGKVQGQKGRRAEPIELSRLKHKARGIYLAEEMLVNWGGGKVRKEFTRINQTNRRIWLSFGILSLFWLILIYDLVQNVYEYWVGEQREKKSKVELMQLWTCCNCSCCATNCTSYQVTQSKACEIIWNSAGIKYFERKVLCGTSFGAQLQAGSMSKDSRLRECVAPRYPVALWRQLGLFESSNLLALRHRVSW